MTTTNPAAVDKYAKAIENLPEEAFLGSLLYFSISQADVHLERARAALEQAGLDTSHLRKNLRPIDAFRKATKAFSKKFQGDDDVRTEFLVRPVGDDNERIYVHLILERFAVRSGKKRRLFYEKVGELTLNRGVKKDGEYSGHSVESRRLTASLESPLTTQEDQWLTERLAVFADDFEHRLTHMDSHAVRTFVRESIYGLSGCCVKESGGLYFIKQEHAGTVADLQTWVQNIGSEFHALPLLNLADQREMIMEAFEEEALGEIDRLMGEVADILKDTDRKIEPKTFNGYLEEADRLRNKIKEYDDMLDSRSLRATAQLGIYSKQVMSLTSRVKEPRRKVST